MRQTRYLLVIGVTALVLISAVGPALAHETQAVAGNEVTFGGADEPLVTGERMWLEFEIVDAESGDPVENVSENLTVSVQMEGHEKTALESSDKYGEPGVYEARSSSPRRATTSSTWKGPSTGKRCTHTSRKRSTIAPPSSIQVTMPSLAPAATSRSPTGTKRSRPVSHQRPPLLSPSASSGSQRQA